MSVRKAIQDRIKDQCTDISQVGGAADFSAITREYLKTPSAFVIRTMLDSGDEGGYGGDSQVIEERFSILIVVASINDPKGADSSDAVHTHADTIRTALMGWVPVDGYDPLKYLGGSLFELNKGVLAWQENYQTAYEFSNEEEV